MDTPSHFDTCGAVAAQKKAAKYFLPTKEKRPVVSRTHRKCSHCHTVKELHSFPIAKSAHLGRKYKCYNCTAAYLREKWRRDYPEKPPAPKKTHEEKLAWDAQYRDKNRDVIRERMRFWMRTHYNRIWQSMKARVMRYTKGQPYSVSKLDIGLSPQEFKDYIEGLWKPGMAWDNYGHFGGGSKSWVMHFIRPASQTNWDDYEDYKRVIHYTNMEPAWWADVSGERRVYAVHTNIAMTPNVRII